MTQTWRILRVLIFTLLAIPSSFSAEISTTASSVAALDQILANVKPGQKTARIDDMEILVKNLRAWRNHLARLPRRAAAFDGTIPTWPGGNVYYAFSNNVSAAKQKAVLDGAAEWAMFANLHFIPRTIEANYITFRQNDSLDGGQSAVGMIGGEQFTQYGSNAWKRSTICHEIGHALGLIHEHQRSDRDLYVVILTNNITSGHIGNFPKLTDSRNQGPYDFLSIMHYSRNSWSIDPATLNTIEPLPQYIQYLDSMGAKNDPPLSASDRAGIAAIYGAAAPNTNVVTNTQDSGLGSLRAAVYYAFDHNGISISFNISTNDPGFSNGRFTIQLTDSLPSLLNNTTIDGTTQPNGSATNPPISLSSVSPPLPGTYPCALRMHGTNSVVRGLMITGVPAMGILIEQGASSNLIGGPIANQRNIISGNGQQGIVIRDTNSTANVIQGNYIGLNPDGTAAVSNGWEGVGIYNGAGGNLVINNVLSGNGVAGVRIGGSPNNSVQGNFIGLNAAGTAAVPNGWHGVGVFGGAQSNIIGGFTMAARNIISGNSHEGVVVADPDSMGNQIVGNYVGLNAAGAAALPNGWSGVAIFNGAQSNTVGGTLNGAGNVISGNAQQGIIIVDINTLGNVVAGNYVGLDPTGTAVISNNWTGVSIWGGAQSNLVGGYTSAARNIISGNGNQGVVVADPGSAGNVIAGNYVGLNAAGAAALPNAWSGVAIFNGAQSNTVGGTLVGAGNVISGNALQGVIIVGVNTIGNVVAGNCIGLSPTGATAISNGFTGVSIWGGAQSNLVGGYTIAARNIISGNGNQGAVVADPGSVGNVIAGNYIGLNAAGTAAMPNAFSGVAIFNGAQSNTVGGALAGAGNVISGNAQQGVGISGANTLGNTVVGNYIGLDPTGTIAISNSWAGVSIWGGAQSNLVGGYSSAARNIISGNGNQGMVVADLGSAGNVIVGNYIGLNAAGTAAVPNTWQGVAMWGGAQGNLIGGLTAGSANIIASNRSDAIQLSDAATSNNTARGNSIYGNGGVSIGLYNSANRSAAAPVLTSAVLTTNTLVAASLTSLASTTFQIDFYSSPPPAASAQGQTYLGSKSVTTSAGGVVSFTASIGAQELSGRIITATATDSAGNTSPMSAGISVAVVSTVNDGIPDWWRALFFGGNGATTNASSCASCDPDADGFSNLQEYLAVTNPTDGNSHPSVASFTASPTNGTVTLSVSFIDASTGTITNRFWSFGDGGTTNTAATNVVYTYTVPGTNTVQLIVSGPSGVSSNSLTIIVTAYPPGDVNGDLHVTSADSLLVNQVLVGLRNSNSAAFARTGFPNGDVNQNAAVSGADSLLINQVIVGLRAYVVTKIVPGVRSNGVPTAVSIYGIGFPTNTVTGVTIGPPVNLALSNIVVISRERISAVVPVGGGIGTGTVSVTATPSNGVTSFGRFINP